MQKAIILENKRIKGAQRWERIARMSMQATKPGMRGILSTKHHKCSNCGKNKFAVLRRKELCEGFPRRRNMCV